MTQLSAANPELFQRLQKQAQAELDELMNSLSGLSAGVIATSDGFEVAARARAGVEVSKLAAMACSISALGAMVGVESEIGQYQNVVVEADEGYVVIIDIPHPLYPMILNLVAARNEVLGQVLYLAKRAVSRVSKAS
jgi:predicted regulator of Ras-like GTPase activity (Roadblock/LC7/MglB family)